MTPFDKPQLPEAAQTPKSFYQAAEQELPWNRARQLIRSQVII